jgi:hypothetical protein
VLTFASVALSALLSVQSIPAYKASDAELIANWVCGKDTGQAFDHPFGDSRFLAERNGPLLYTDIPGVAPPAVLKTVNYEFIQAQLRMIRGGHKVAPAVLIVRSSLDDPPEERGAREIRVGKPRPIGRVYYVEVALGNLAHHWLKVVIREEGGKPRAEIIRSAVS